MCRAKGRYEIVAHPIITGTASACCISRYRKQNNFYAAISWPKNGKLVRSGKKKLVRYTSGRSILPRKD